MDEDYYNRLAWQSFDTLKVGDKISLTVTKTGLSWLMAIIKGQRKTVTKIFEVKALVQ